MPNRAKIMTALEQCNLTRGCKGCPYVKSVNDAIAMLKEQPEIIRCKDCKHGADTIINGEYLFKTCGGVNHEPDWFCANAERR